MMTVRLLTVQLSTRYWPLERSVFVRQGAFHVIKWIHSHWAFQFIFFCQKEWISGIHCAQARTHASEGSTLALKARADITRSPKQGYQWPHKKDMWPPKKFLKKEWIWWQTQRKFKCTHNFQNIWFVALNKTRRPQWWIQDFPQEGALTAKVGVATYYFGQFFPKTTWKWNKLWPRGDGHSWRPILDLRWIQDF